MSIVIPSFLLPPSVTGGIHLLPAKEQNALKQKYIEQLDNSAAEYSLQRPNFGLLDFQCELSKQPLEIVQPLYLALREVFTPECQNSDRSKVVRYLLRAAQDEWSVILQQVCFIMPIGTRGHDVAWATEILAGIKNPAFRDQLVNTANRLFKYDTLTVERGYILKALAKMNSDELSALDQAGQEERDLFFKNNVPASLKQGAQICRVIDPVLGKSWEV